MEGNFEAAERQLREDVETYTDSLLRTCYFFLRDKALAEDVVQETFLRSWKHRDVLKNLHPKKRKAWLATTAINLCRDTQRTKWFRGRIWQTALEDIPPEILAAEQEDRSLLMEVCNLPNKYKHVVLLYYYQELTTREIAQTLSISAPAVSKRLKKARQLLKGRLEE